MSHATTQEVSAVSALIKSKVYVNTARAYELEALREHQWASASPDAQPKGRTLLCLNTSPLIHDAAAVLPYELQVEHITKHLEEDEAAGEHLVKLFTGQEMPTGSMRAVLYELDSKDEHLSDIDQRVIALSLLMGLPIVCVSTACHDPLPAASAATMDTWPVFFVPHAEDTRLMREWLEVELPRVLALLAAVETNMQARVAHLTDVNAPLHFLKRASVALVPFGVNMTNHLELLQVTATMLQDLGMRHKYTKTKALKLLASTSGIAAGRAVDDILHFTAFATMLGELHNVGSNTAKEQALALVDGLTLGLGSLISAPILAIDSLRSRPVIIRALTRFLAGLQTMYALNPAVRRDGEGAVDGAEAGAGKGSSSWWRKGEAPDAANPQAMRRQFAAAPKPGARRDLNREAMASKVLDRAPPEEALELRIYPSGSWERSPSSEGSPACAAAQFQAAASTVAPGAGAAAARAKQEFKRMPMSPADSRAHGDQDSASPDGAAPRRSGAGSSLVRSSRVSRAGVEPAAAATDGGSIEEEAEEEDGDDDDLQEAFGILLDIAVKSPSFRRSGTIEAAQ